MANIALQGNSVVLNTIDGIQKVSCECCNPLLAIGESIGEGLGCVMGAPLQVFYRNPPYTLNANRSYLLRMIVGTGDTQYHQNAFYEAHFSFSPSISLSWTTYYYTGTSTDPWTISNAGQTLRFDFEDSTDCGGTNDNVQYGYADALLQPASTTSLMLSFTGNVERQASGFDAAGFYLFPLP